MTQEKKQLLLKDLCSRLPYGVVGLYTWKCKESYNRELTGSLYDELELSWSNTDDSQFLPYLRPLSSMTENEFQSLKRYSGLIYYQLELQEFYDNSKCLEFYLSEIPSYVVILVFDWLNKYHFDYRGLIPMGLALEATKDMYNS